MSNASEVNTTNDKIVKDGSNLNNLLQVEIHNDGDGANMIEKISNFVESVRQEENQKRRESEVKVPGFDEATDRTERTILEAEKFRAAVETPPGKSFDYCQDKLENQQIGTGLTDDNFFHLTCHIEPALQQKIEKGEFVDLDKLLPRDKGFGRNFADENRMEWVHKEGCTYLAPVKRESRINGIRKWEQAFRVYATIYCTANPHRAREVWQYISVINTAAASFCWDNVANYDITFRHLMQFNPTRNWAVTYNQMWNLCMKDPLPKNFPSRGGGANSFSAQAGGQSSTSNFLRGGNNNQGKRSKNDYCWSFNRGQTCKFGNKCKFIERCSYCDKASHGVYLCPKLGKGSSNHGHHQKHSHKGAGDSGSK